MKKIIFLMIVLGLTACGVTTNKVDSDIDKSLGRACSLEAKFVGSWKNDVNGEILSIGTTCALATDLCHVLGATTQAEEADGSIFLSIDQSDGGTDCMPVGQHSCTYSIHTDYTKLEVNCSGLIYKYTKK